ncbi:hypothetical protein HDZ31DRAFT_28483 [Schizophyllum fasciatum]
MNAVFPPGCKEPKIADDPWTLPMIETYGPDDLVWHSWEPLLIERGYTALAAWPFRLMLKSNHRQGQRLSDGAFVVVKFVLWRRFRVEVDVSRRLLSSDRKLPGLSRFPLLDVIDVPLEAEGGASLIVSEVCAEQNAWCDLKNPRDILHGMHQLVESMHCLHANGIAHCDIWKPNIVVRLPLHRPLRWTLIDFNSAVIAELDAPPPTITPLHHTGSRFEAPEFYAPYWTQLDPFAYDVFCLGNVMDSILQVLSSFVRLMTRTLHWQGSQTPISPSFRALVDSMIDENPSSRPDSAAVLSRFAPEIEQLAHSENDDPEDALPAMFADSHKDLYQGPHSLLAYLYEIEYPTEAKDWMLAHPKPQPSPMDVDLPADVLAAIFGFPASA